MGLLDIYSLRLTGLATAAVNIMNCGSLPKGGSKEIDQSHEPMLYLMSWQIIRQLS